MLASKIENNYDVVAQLLTEMCDAGTVGTTEPNALRDLVEVEGFMGKLLGNLSLPGYVTLHLAASHLVPLATNMLFAPIEASLDLVRTFLARIHPRSSPQTPQHYHGAGQMSAIPPTRCMPTSSKP